MKFITVRLCCLLFFSGFFFNIAHAQWSRLPGPFGGDVFFLEQYAGAFWAGAESGLYRSSDGLEWSQVSNLGNSRVLAGLVDHDTLYILRGIFPTQLLTTIDGGQSWLAIELTNEYPGIGATLKKTAGTLIIADLTNGSLYLSSKDNGASFGDLPGNGPGNVDLFDANGALAAYYNGSVLRISQNGGNSFFSRPLPPNNSFAKSVVVTDSAIVSLGDRYAARPGFRGLVSARRDRSGGVCDQYGCCTAWF